MKNPLIELEIENYVNNNLNQNSIKYLVNGQIKWKFESSNEINAVSFSKKYLACSCKQNELNLFKIDNGAQLCSPIVLDDDLASLKCNLNYFMSITCNGFLYVWSFDNSDCLVKILINRQSCSSIFKG